MTDQALALRQQTEAPAIIFDDPTRELIRKSVGDPRNPLTRDEFDLFVAVCQTMGANPLLREIYPLKSQGRLSIVVGIDQYRKQAQRSPRYGGQVGPFWCGSDSVWRDVWLEKGPPAACKVGILLRGAAEPTWGVAKFASYVRKSPTWDAMPEHMLAIRAEAHALRKCFSREIGAVELSDDDDLPQVVGSVESAPAPALPPAEAAPVVAAQADLDGARALYQECKAAGIAVEKPAGTDAETIAAWLNVWSERLAEHRDRQAAPESEPDAPEEWDEAPAAGELPFDPGPSVPVWQERFGQRVSSLLDRADAAGLRFDPPAYDADDETVAGWLSSKNGLLKSRGK